MGAIVRTQNQRYRFFNAICCNNRVRDAGVAGSNPATPTSFLSTFDGYRDSYWDRNIPDPPDGAYSERAPLPGRPDRKAQFLQHQRITVSIGLVQVRSGRRRLPIPHDVGSEMAPQLWGPPR